ncbi:hypothetical protein BYT27DRAFT_7205062 [Phlegmacium glaucopus]|nr:hypothetical protein BYT27DRAFT_7205062 [Phlegmacium glaucopus]
MSVSDRGYTILLSHLHNPATKLDVSTIQGALAYQLANISPLPTSLAALTVSSPFYLSQPFTYPKLHSLCTAFRHASHLKYRALVESHKNRSTLGSLLGRTLRTALGQWVNDILRGLQGGHSVLRLASCAGLLLGVEDLKVGGSDENMKGIDLGSARSVVEDETVVAVAEVMDAYAYGFGSSSSNGIEEWEKEFQPAGQDILSLALILASQSLPLVHQHKLKALPLSTLARLLTSTISSTFKSGTFLSSVSASITLSPQHHAHISTSSPLAQTLQSMASSPLTVSIAPISRLAAITLALLVDEDGLFTVSESLDILQQMAKQVERDWISCPLASFTDLEIVPDSQGITKSIWSTLKTLLFSNIMLAEAVLSASVFTPPRPYGLTPASLALQVLQTLSHLSFVISQFGGVTTTTQGFEHLKKTFYLALDILAQGDGDGLKAEAYVQQVCFALNSQRIESAATSPRQAKQAFILASIEQLVPVLSDKSIRDWVWGVCYPHLYDPSHRETYESAHSVILSIFASHAQRQHTGDSVSDSSTQTSPTIPNSGTRVLSGVLDAGGDGPKDEGTFTSIIPISDSHREAKEESIVAANFVKRMVPFYAQCLIENSMDGKLSTPQLRLAYSALVRSATVTSTGAPGDMYTLAWYCVQLLIDTIRDLSPPLPYISQIPKGKSKAQENPEPDNNLTKVDNRIHRLSLMLISTIPSLPLTLMLRALDEIRIIIMAHSRSRNDSGIDDGNKDEALQSERKGRKKELLEALFAEILEKIGDREKETAIKWWYRYRPALISESGDDNDRDQEGQQPQGPLGTSFLTSSSWFTKRRGVEKAKDVDIAREREENPSSNPPVLSRL